jgi:simple sugar transport system ATP-binding protein
VPEFDIRTASIAARVASLSGGNQQKVILAREIGRELRVLLASQPTRGLDVGSIEFVHRRIVEQRDRGLAVILVSSELDEIYALADRIAVMYEGKITGFRPPTVSVEELGLLMTGASTDTEDGDVAAGPVAQAGPLDAVGGTTGAENPGSAAAEAGDTGQPGQEEPS